MAAPLLPPEALSSPDEISMPESRLGIVDISPKPGQFLSEHDLYMLTHTTVESVFPARDPSARNKALRIELPDGSMHRRLYTPSEDPEVQPPFRVVNILGYTESIDAPHVRKYHDQLAHMLPSIPVSTEATYGIDGTADELNTWQKLGLTHDDVAQRLFDVLHLTYDDMPIIPVSTSQGASILARVRDLHEADGSHLTFQDQILYEPYLLTKEQKCFRILSRFIGGHVLIDGTRELLKHTRPSEIPELWWDQARSMPHFKEDATALLAHGIGNLRRTEQRVITNMLAYGALVLQGSVDCLGCEETNSLPGVELKRVPGKGHSMGMNPAKRALSVAKALRHRGHLPATS